MRRAPFGAVLVAALSSLAIESAGARDLGVRGQVWSIVEIDLRQLLIESAARADWDRVQAGLRDSAQHFLSRLPKRDVVQASRTTTRWLDPSFVLDDDIRAPVQNAAGEWQWSVLYSKGTRFNPLSLQRPSTAMLFFNGTAREEVAFASELNKRYPGRLMLVEASGIDPSKLARALKVPVYTASEQMFARFSLRATPALLYAGEGEQALRLGLTEFARPLAPAHAENVWPAMRR